MSSHRGLLPSQFLAHSLAPFMAFLSPRPPQHRSEQASHLGCRSAISKCCNTYRYCSSSHKSGNRWLIAIAKYVQDRKSALYYMVGSEASLSVSLSLCSCAFHVTYGIEGGGRRGLDRWMWPPGGAPAIQIEGSAKLSASITEHITGNSWEKRRPSLTLMAFASCSYSLSTYV